MKKLIKNGLIVLLGMLLFNQVTLAEGVIPSNVYRLTEDVVAEIKLIRQAVNATEKAEDPGLQFNKKPLYVLTKSIELQEKISTAQKKNGINQMSISKIPLRKITPSHVYDIGRASKSKGAIRYYTTIGEHSGSREYNTIRRA